MAGICSANAGGFPEIAHPTSHFASHKNYFPALKRNSFSPHYPCERGRADSKLGGQVVASAVARVHQEVPIARGDVTSVAEGTLPRARRETFQALVMQALQLRRIYREVFILCDIKGYSQTETATILNINEDAVGKRLRRARSQMGQESKMSLEQGKNIEFL
jgi:hypothetical protein